MNKVPFYFFPFVYIAGRGLAMELGCLQSPFTTSVEMPSNLWEVGERTVTCRLGVDWGPSGPDCFRSCRPGPGPEEEELLPPHFCTV